MESVSDISAPFFGLKFLKKDRFWQKSAPWRGRLSYAVQTLYISINLVLY